MICWTKLETWTLIHRCINLIWKTGVVFQRPRKAFLIQSYYSYYLLSFHMHRADHRVDKSRPDSAKTNVVWRHWMSILFRAKEGGLHGKRVWGAKMIVHHYPLLRFPSFPHVLVPASTVPINNHLTNKTIQHRRFWFNIFYSRKRQGGNKNNNMMQNTNIYRYQQHKAMKNTSKELGDGHLYCSGVRQ